MIFTHIFCIFGWIGGACGQILVAPTPWPSPPASGAGFNHILLAAGEREDMDRTGNPGRRSRVTTVTRDLDLGYPI